MKKLPLHWQIVIGMALGILFGLLISSFSWGGMFVNDWIAPFGTIFIKLLKLIAIPLIFTSLVKGISDLKDISSFRNIGVRTILIYISTTVVAIIIGLLLVIFFAIAFGISMLLIDSKKVKPLNKLIDGLNEVILKMVDLIMLMAPFAVFALLAQIIASSGNVEILQKLLIYGVTVVIGLAIMITFYLLVVYLVAGKSPGWFFKGIAPAQLLAFSTSSSAATLPVTMERVTEHLGVDNEVSSFVLPVGATINMDGTSLYQAVAAVFIAQALHFPLEFSDQLIIVLTALLASIGSAAVPGAGMVMLVIVLESIGFPADKLAIGLALIFAIDRPLDMLRTVVNVTGDSMVSVVVAKSLGKLHSKKSSSHHSIRSL